MNRDPSTLGCYAWSIHWLQIRMMILQHWMLDRSFAALVLNGSHDIDKAKPWVLVNQAVKPRLDRADMLAMQQLNPQARASRRLKMASRSPGCTNVWL